MAAGARPGEPARAGPRAQGARAPPPGGPPPGGGGAPFTTGAPAATPRLPALGRYTAVEDQVSCGFAVQDKVWTDGPDGEPWEIYTVLADAEMPAGQLREVEPGGDAMCCSSAPESADRCC